MLIPQPDSQEQIIELRKNKGRFFSRENILEKKYLRKIQYRKNRKNYGVKL